jgi:hypothetical protein
MGVDALLHRAIATIIIITTMHLDQRASLRMCKRAGGARACVHLQPVDLGATTRRKASGLLVADRQSMSASRTGPKLHMQGLAWAHGGCVVSQWALQTMTLLALVDAEGIEYWC